MAQEDISSLEEKFDAAVRVIRSLPENGVYKPSDDMMLMFYSYHKQATLGPCHIPRPTGFWDSHGKAKWDAWNSLGNMTKEEAMMSYVEDIQLILETIPISDEVSDLVEKLGNFYAEVDRGVEGEENEVDKRPFTRPFSEDADKLTTAFKQPLMEGFGDLWDAIQNPRGTAEEGNVLTACAEDVEARGENSELEKSQGFGRSEESEDDMSVEDVDDDAECEHEADEEEKAQRRSPDLRLLGAGEPQWRLCAGGLSSSVEPSVSLFTNGTTPSSLNSEVEEEELACVVETNSYGHLCDYGSALSEKHYRATDSDNEEFCDSMEHLAMEEGSGISKEQICGSRAVSLRQRDLLGDTKTLYNGRVEDTLPGNPVFEVELSTAQPNSSLSERGRVLESPRAPCCSQRCVVIETGRCCILPSGHAGSVATGDVNKQISMALLRLQDDMANVLHRLHTLEVLTVSQTSSPSPKQEDHVSILRNRPSWWPFHLSPASVAFTTIWPLFAYWLVHLYLHWRKRKAR